MFLRRLCNPFLVGGFVEKVYKTKVLEEITDSGGNKVYLLTDNEIRGLIYLQELGFPPFSHLHSGNVLIMGNTCRIVGLENVIMGCPNSNKLLDKRFKKHRNSADVICLGHLMYEMATGHKVKTFCPDQDDYHFVTDPEIEEILRYIFENPEGFPSVKQLSCHSFFLGMQQTMDKISPKKLLSPEANKLLKYLKHGKQKVKKSKEKRNLGSRRQKETTETNEPINGHRQYHVMETPTSNQRGGQPAQPLQRVDSSSFSEVPAGKAETELDKVRGHNNSTGSSLLQEIQTFTSSSLKKTKTRDSSKPKIYM